MFRFNNGEYFNKTVGYKNHTTGEYASLFIHNITYIVCTNKMTMTTTTPIEAHNLLDSLGFKEISENEISNELG